MTKLLTANTPTTRETESSRLGGAGGGGGYWMGWKKYIGKKVLIRKIGRSNIREVKIEDVSPSGRFVKIREGWIINEWIDGDEYELLEVLGDG